MTAYCYERRADQATEVTEKSRVNVKPCQNKQVSKQKCDAATRPKLADAAAKRDSPRKKREAEVKVQS